MATCVPVWGVEAEGLGGGDGLMDLSNSIRQMHTCMQHGEVSHEVQQNQVPCTPPPVSSKQKSTKLIRSERLVFAGHAEFIFRRYTIIGARLAQLGQ